MDIERFTKEELILSAMKSEIDSYNIYMQLSNIVKNFLLKEKLKFLAEEEKKHRKIFYNIYKDIYKKEPVVPEKTFVPLPEIKIEENMQISDLLSQSMEAEKSAYDFYLSMVDKFEDKISKLLKYIASMEMGHFKLLEIEREHLEYFEDFDAEWPMIHMGA